MDPQSNPNQTPASPEPAKPAAPETAPLPTPAPAAPVTPAAQPAPAAPATPASAPAPAPAPAPAAPAASGPAIADDVDVIEKEWVDKAEQVVKATAADPHKEEDAVEDLQIDYLKKRYGKDIKKSDQ